MKYGMGRLVGVLVYCIVVGTAWCGVVNSAHRVATCAENTVVLAKDLVVNYMQEARAAYGSPEYADYKTSIASKYSVDKTKGYDKPNPVSLSWERMPGTESYTLLISKTEDFSNVVFTAENVKGTSCTVYNLRVGTVYFWKVKSGVTESGVKKFRTDDTVRYINVDGVRNVRDLGGWNGLNQGWAFRGSELDYVEEHRRDGLNLTDAGRKVLHDDLGIKTDLDFRVTALTESPIGSDVKFINGYRIGSYMAAFTSALFSGAIRTFADIDNYPIYFHCWGGADRTGTVAFILEALCGVTETELAMDYELTTFSVFGHRTRVDNPWYKYASMVAKLKEYPGATLKEKAENYAMTTLGLTRSEVSNIQSILSGNAVVFEQKNACAVVGRETSLPLKNVGTHTVLRVTVNGKAVDFAMRGNVLSIKATEGGEGVIVFEDGHVLKFAALLDTGSDIHADHATCPSV